MKLHIYNQETKEIAVIINGETNEICESKADKLNYDLDIYAWSYTTGNELHETTETIEEL
jgi:hypothetical protein